LHSSVQFLQLCVSGKRERMAVTLKDVAKLAQVSESTASRALNDSPRISSPTKQAVWTAARKLGYRSPGKTTWSSRTIGVIEPNVTNPLFAEIISTIESRIYQAGYNIILCDSTQDPAREQSNLELLVQQGVSGIMIIPIDATAGHVRDLIEHKLPCVILGTEPIPNADQVNVDATMGAYLATRHLLELGHRRIGLICGPMRISACRARLVGHQRALAERQVAFDEGRVAEGKMDVESGAVAMAQLLPQVPDRLSAIYAINDAMAIGALRVLRQAGLRVPEDVSLIGCDDIPVAAQLYPALTTLWQPKRELGELAAKLILRQIKTREEHGDRWREKYPFQSAMYLPRVVERDSTRPYQESVGAG
jgi:LacI family transcriptional regulator